MKTMTCKQLGGACELAFHANTFDEIATQSKQHGMDMYRQADQPHLEAMKAMQSKMQSPADMQAWFESKRKEFDALPEEQ